MPDHDHRHDHHTPAPWEPGLRLLAICVLVAAVLGIEAIHLARRAGPPKLQIPPAVPVAQVTPLGGPVTKPAVKPAGVGRAAPGDRIDSGLVLTFSMLAGDQVLTDSRVTRLPSLYVPAGTAPSPFLPAGRFRAVFDGFVNMDVWDLMTFSAEGRGEIKLTVNGKVVLEGTEIKADQLGTKIKLEKGKNKISLSYRAPEQGDAWVRLYWASDEVPREPLPPAVLRHEAAALDAQATALREGRQLVGDLRCTKCHAFPDAGATAMPELALDAPDLSKSGSRLNPAWVASWIRDPRALRPSASMPGMLHGPEADKDATDIAAWLATLGAPSPAVDAANDETVSLGGHLFASLGCMSCHGSQEGGTAHIPLTQVKAKWQQAGLAAFLQKPSAHYAWIRMPDFRLSAEEAGALAAFLTTHEQKPVAAPGDLAKADAARGKVRFAELGCMSCHKTEGAENRLAVAKLRDLDKASQKGCLAADQTARGKAPDFHLDQYQVAAIGAFLAGGVDSLKSESPIEFAERRLVALNCVACHERDGANDVYSGMADGVREFIDTLPAPADPDLTDTTLASLEQKRPLLTWAGEKLKPQWMARFIAGEIPYKPRDWMPMRMPGFPAASAMLAQGLALGHGCAPEAAADPAFDPALADIGKGLLGADGGFACNTCHGIGEVGPTAVFEAPGINLAWAPQRLRNEFFHRWLRKPLRVDPYTKMPQFAGDDGKSPLAEILDGKAAKQYEAIWHHLQRVDAEWKAPR